MSVEATTRAPASAGDPTVPREGSRWAEASTRSLHGRCWQAPSTRRAVPIVVVHGLGVASRMCQPVAARLARWHPVYAPDLAGFGRSRGGSVLDIDAHADDLAAWLGAMRLERPVVVGVSVGSQVVTALVQRHADLCRGAVLGSPTVDASRRSWLRQLPRWQLEQATQSMRMRAIQVADYARAGIPRVVRTFAGALADRPEARLPDVTVPVLVCWGTRDPLLSRWWATTLTEAAPQGRLRVIPGGLHALTHESALEFARVILHFVPRGLDDATPSSHAASTCNGG